jgi:tRNA (guanine37-N1)-methyltransferase
MNENAPLPENAASTPSPPSLRCVVISLFPEMFPGPLGYSLAGKALREGLWSLESLQLRDFALDKHATVDDRPFGGGTGMVLKPDVVDAAILAAKAKLPHARCIYFSPRGRPMNQRMAEEFATGDVILLCGRFEGVDERVLQTHSMQEISLGDFVLSGGEIPALAFLDACIRCIPGVIGKESVHDEESFGEGAEFAGLLEYPHYTRPSFWKGMPVPDTLLSGNHSAIKSWRLAQAEAVTKERRHDLWQKYCEQKQPHK